MLTEERSAAEAQDVRRERASGASSRLRRIGQASLTPLAFLILPNLPLLFLRQRLTLTPHGLINVECLLLGVCSVFLPRSLVFALLTFDIFGAFLYEVCYTFQFSLSQLWSSAPFLVDLPLHRRMEIGVALALVIATAWVTAYMVPRTRYRRTAVIALLALVAVLSAVDVLDGQNPVFLRDSTLFSQRLTISPWVELAVRGRLNLSVDSSSLHPDIAPMASASVHAMDYLNRLPAGVRPNIVELVVESWGLLRDSRLQQLMTAPYDDPRVTAAYHVSFGTAPFNGLTVPGEARELCHSHMGFGILHISEKQGATCLPEIFDARGYKTVAIHGYLGGMFDRSHWYAHLGFSQEWFEKDLRHDGLPRCIGAFPGICDTAIAHWIGSQVLTQNENQPKFVYWMTLNSHIPVPAHPNLPRDNLCRQGTALENSSALCSWFRLIHAVHQSVAQIALQQTQQPTVFVLVGDHAPPFASPDLRADFSGASVPYVLLTPKALDRFADGSPSAGQSSRITQGAERLPVQPAAETRAVR